MNALIREVEELMEPGERVVWVGRPVTGLLLRRHDVFLIPFSLMWGGFAIVWEAVAIKAALRGTDKVLWLLPLFGLLFVFIGLWMMVGRFFFDAARRKRIIYLITNRRVMIRSGREKSLAAANLHEISEPQLIEQRNGRGSILLPGIGPAKMVGRPGRLRAIHAAPGFEDLPTPLEPYDTLVRERARALQAYSPEGT